MIEANQLHDLIVKPTLLSLGKTFSQPSADDIQGIPRYWKEHYNTVKGKGSREQFIRHFNHYIAGVL